MGQPRRNTPPRLRKVKGPSPSMLRSLNTTLASSVLMRAGTWVSPSITWFVREWCTACDRLPGEVRHQEERVEDVPDGVLDQLVVAEGAVAALVGDDPAPGGARAGDEGVRDPRGEERELEGKVEVREDAASDRERGGDGGVHQGLGGVLDEAVLGDLAEHLGHAGEGLLVGVQGGALEASPPTSARGARWGWRRPPRRGPRRRRASPRRGRRGEGQARARGGAGAGLSAW